MTVRCLLALLSGADQDASVFALPPSFEYSEGHALKDVYFLDVGTEDSAVVLLTNTGEE